MIGWILSRTKWFLLLAAVGAPVFAYFDYTSGVEMKEVLANGQEVVANIDGGTVKKGRRSGTSYSLDLVWTDKSGAKQSAEKVSITSALADKLIVGDNLVRNTVKIKYLAGSPETKPVIIEDAANKQKIRDEFLPILIVAGLIGAIGSAAFFAFGRRKTVDA
jgi:hypothetical protein